MVALRLVQISDLHLSCSHPFFFYNWDIVAEALNADPPDLIVASGHLHAWRQRRWNRSRMVWAPAQSFVLRHPDLPPTGGVRRVGYVEYRIDGTRLAAAFRSHPWLIDHDISNWVSADSQALYRRIADAPFRTH